MNKVKKSITVAKIRLFYTFSCIIFLPIISINAFTHKKGVKKNPFRKSIIVNLCEKYPRIYQLYNSIMNYPLGNNVYSILPEMKGKVLQVGAGTGALNLYLKSSSNNEDLELYNLDVNKNSIEYALKRKIYTDCICADICDVTVEDGFFDVIIFARCFHHIRKPAAAFKKCICMLKKGGIIIIADVVSLADNFPSKSFMMNSNFDGLIWRYNPVGFQKHIEKALPESLQIQSIDYIRQYSVTNYNSMYPHTDGLVLIEKIE